MCTIEEKQISFCNGPFINLLHCFCIQINLDLITFFKDWLCFFKTTFKTICDAICFIINKNQSSLILEQTINNPLNKDRLILSFPISIGF